MVGVRDYLSTSVAPLRGSSMDGRSTGLHIHPLRGSSMDGRGTELLFHQCGPPSADHYVGFLFEVVPAWIDPGMYIRTYIHSYSYKYSTYAHAYAWILRQSMDNLVDSPWLARNFRGPIISLVKNDSWKNNPWNKINWQGSINQFYWSSDYSKKNLGLEKKSDAQSCHNRVSNVSQV